MDRKLDLSYLAKPFVLGAMPENLRWRHALFGAYGLWAWVSMGCSNRAVYRAGMPL